MDDILNDLSELFEQVVLVPARERIQPIRTVFEEFLQYVGVDIDPKYVELLLVGVFIVTAIIVFYVSRQLAEATFLPSLRSLICEKCSNDIREIAPGRYQILKNGCNVTVVISECS
uniref:Uncharacterized protein n=1 Tax=Aplanochytrium stocchinoi TaxID=215587 RepID=A0A7S3LNI6_9STRA|mmetsp:Transcript_10637/g.13324  ORF Transcript_10637/g.13324 Transcript_10637/m.13324 type:complete len:116 (-) Transcript_10637:478-825(-)